MPIRSKVAVLGVSLAVLGPVPAGAAAKPEVKPSPAQAELDPKHLPGLECREALLSTDVAEFDALVREQDVPAVVVK
jgi:hypothetical protein